MMRTATATFPWRADTDFAASIEIDDGAFIKRRSADMMASTARAANYYRAPAHSGHHAAHWHRRAQLNLLA